MLRKKIVNILVKPIIELYLKFDTSFTYKGLNLKILTGVFHPQFFFSSKYLAEFIEQLDLKGKAFCEPCSGSGLISLVAFQKGANVCCFDINPKAVSNIIYNFNKNFRTKSKDVIFNILESDSFKNVPEQLFDYVVINPPYFFKEVKSPSMYAWNCGENGEFFKDFFSSLKKYLSPKGKCYMVLADNCDIDRIATLAHCYSWSFRLINERKIAWEKNFIFEITLNLQ